MFINKIFEKVLVFLIITEHLYLNNI